MAGRLGFSKCCGPQLFGRIGEVGAKSSQQAWATTFSIWLVAVSHGNRSPAISYMRCWAIVFYFFYSKVITPFLILKLNSRELSTSLPLSFPDFQSPSELKTASICLSQLLVFGLVVHFALYNFSFTVNN